MSQLAFDWTTTSVVEHEKPRGSVVYFIEAVGTGGVKIGWTRDIVERVKALRCGSAVEMRLIKCISGTSKEEAALHRRFRQHRQRGEWFDLAPILADILALQHVNVTLPVCCGCGVALSGYHHIRCRQCSATYQHSMSKVGVCCDCGCAIKRPDKATRCRPCAGKLRHAQYLAKHGERRRLHCNGCGRQLGQQHHEHSGTGLCRSCAMRLQWSTPEYRAAIAPARASEGMRKRRECLHCGKREPLLGSGAKYHPACWLAASHRKSTVQLCLPSTRHEQY